MELEGEEGLEVETVDVLALLAFDRRFHELLAVRIEARHRHMVDLHLHVSLRFDRVDSGTGDVVVEDRVEQPLYAYLLDQEDAEEEDPLAVVPQLAVGWQRGFEGYFGLV